MNLRTVSISRWLKKILKSPSLQTLGIFAGGNLLVAVLGGLGSLLQARLVGPEVLGELAKFGILTGYLNVGLVLVHDGLMRQFPYLLGQGNKEEALKVAAAAKWWYLFLSWLFTLFFIPMNIAKIRKNAKQFKALTSLTVVEFDTLLPVFESLWEDRLAIQWITPLHPLGQAPKTPVCAPSG